MEDCAKTKEDWTRFLDMISIFNSPVSFAYHVGKDLLVNGKDIYADINSAVSEYKSQDWYHFGYHSGNAAAKTFLGAEEQKVKVAQVIEGMYKPFNLKINVLALLECIGDEDKAALVLDAAVQQFEDAYKTKNILEVFTALFFVYGAYEGAL